MTVKELINTLSKLPSKLQVKAYTADDLCFRVYGIGEVNDDNLVLRLYPTSEEKYKEDMESLEALARSDIF